MICGVFTYGGRARSPQTSVNLVSVLFATQHVSSNHLFQIPSHFCTCELKLHYYQKGSILPLGRPRFSFLILERISVGLGGLVQFSLAFQNIKIFSLCAPRPGKNLLNSILLWFFNLSYCFLVGHNLFVSYIHFKSLKSMQFCLVLPPNVQ